MSGREVFGALFLCGALSCAGEPVVHEAPPDLASSASGEDAAVEPPVVGDSLPTGAVSYFNARNCPVGWEPFADAAGRSIVPSASTDVGATFGTPLRDAEDRAHSHAVTANVSLPTVDYAGIAGEANHGLGRGGAQPLTVTVDAASAGLPYVQLLVCHKKAAPQTQKGLAPAGTLMFFTNAECPSGWGRTTTTEGRFLVGVPEKGTAAQSFGGPPLGSNPSPGPGENRVHQHELQGSITTSAHGIALLSGGLAGGYARDGKHAYRASSDEASALLPYIKLLQCEKL
jgi:hypothetical protein